MTAPVLITGGAGFIGSALADRLAAEGESVLVLDSLVRPGTEANLAWLRRRHPRRLACAIADIRDTGAVAQAARDAAAVFHFAAQVAVTTSIDDPIADLHVNLLGTVTLLEAIRRRRIPLIFASTNKVYGGLHDLALRRDEQWRPRDDILARRGIDETRPLQFCTPYGCSKGGADQYVLDYAASFNLPTAVLRMSCIYGPRQLGTEDQGWVAHFARRAIAGEPITLYGDGRQVRDILYVDDAVAAYRAAWKGIGRIAGQAFNLGGGPDNAVSLRQLISHLGRLLGHDVACREAPWRPNDQRWFVADARRIRAALGLAPPLDWREGVGRMVRSFIERVAVPA